MAALWRFVASH